MQDRALYDLTNLRIDRAASTLREAGALDVDFYERKLRQNAGNADQVRNHLSEAKVALMFIEYQATVTMRDSPDLMIQWLGETFYAEVKYFKRKRQDDLDDEAMRRSPGEFVKVGDVSDTEKRSVQDQISDVARRKKRVYVEGAMNLLVIDSGSDSLQLMTETGARIYDDELRKTPEDMALRRLHGIMTINTWGAVRGGFRNVEFAIQHHSLPPLNWQLVEALKEVARG
ncbi:MAG TPA: hypothetical protein VG456_27545 [Candidatus Sulfopaludibacter sp.]|jgi:hypothetical protein|nr:hypothetical protein [Candidatus Sulfopaludibacter sp.]